MPLERARRLLRPAHRRSEGLFLAEGPHVVRDALDAGAAVEEAFVAHEAASDAEIAACAALAESRAAAVHRVSGRDLARICDTETPQGIVAVVRRPVPPQRPFAAPALWLLLDGVQDPGNVGTLLRSAEAFGAAGAIAGPGTADLWSGKTLRAGQGAHFRLVLFDGPLAPHLDALAAAGGALWAADRGGESVYDAPPPPPLCALALGSEAHGLSPDVLARAQRRVRVPQRGRADSLNVAMAGSVLLSRLAERRP
jgi:TrmH family RNA methyltransferase